MRRAYIGIGANQGNVAATVKAVLAEIAAIEHCTLAGVSSWYRTEPIEAAGPDFINGVAAVDTGLDPLTLLQDLHAIEQRFGRQRGPGMRRNAPRVIDLDLLLMGGLVIRSQKLDLPHPRMHLRGFVLRPLLELDPNIEIPCLGPASRMVAATADQRVLPWAP
jgi:2-amino-4-hydroxy-6-hydroxymethyldihydropteridine diphosphokinase